MNKLLGFSIIYIIIAITIYFVSYYCIAIPSQNSLLQFSAYLVGVFAPITTVATIYITYLVYELNLKDSKTELYFTKIIELIFQIEDDYTSLSKETNDNMGSKGLKRKIQQQVVLARYYLKRFPDKNCPINGLDLELNHIYFDPTNGESYKLLAEEFEKFCLYVNLDKQRPVSYVKNENGEIRFVIE